MKLRNFRPRKSKAFEVGQPMKEIGDLALPVVVRRVFGEDRPPSGRGKDGALTAECRLKPGVIQDSERRHNERSKGT